MQARHTAINTCHPLGREPVGLSLLPVLALATVVCLHARTRTALLLSSAGQRCAHYGSYYYEIHRSFKL